MIKKVSVCVLFYALSVYPSSAEEVEKKYGLPILRPACKAPVMQFNQTASDLQAVLKPSLSVLPLAQVMPFKIPSMKSKLNGLRREINNHCPEVVRQKFTEGYQPVHM